MEDSVDDLIVVYVGPIYRDYGEWSVVGTKDKNFRRFHKVLDQIGVKTSSTVNYVSSDVLSNSMYISFIQLYGSLS